ncbi:MAG: methyltransferase [Acidobacteriota bacterium]|nr:methyltransferase [Acidobacteriota bacterium]
MFSRASKGRLTVKDLGRVQDATLFHRIARAVCRAGCLPRKELFEAWEVARRVRRRFRGGRVVDLGGGHGLLAQILLLLDNSSPHALVVDRQIPASGARVRDVLVDAWPRLDGRVSFANKSVADVPLFPTDLVVSCHACGQLTDQVLARAVGVRARLAVVPCCHDLLDGDTGRLDGWIAGDLAIDIIRARHLVRCGYRIWTQIIPADITPKNRVLLGAPE